MDTQHVFTDLISPDDLFLQGLREDSHLEMDWLWLSTKVSSASQRRYCLQRALAINPESRPAQRGLWHLQRHPEKPLKLE